MKCPVCGLQYESVITDLPFKVNDRAIVILKGLPVLQCERRHEYLIEDAVMERIEEILSRVDAAAELEIIPYAA
jgi:YgiT-type zinc finger domain-containing protein